MSVVLVLEQMAVILLLMLVGAVCQKIGLIRQDQQKILSWLVVNVFNPALAISSALSGGSDGNAIYLAYSFAIAIAMFGSFIILGKVMSFFIKGLHDKVIWQLMVIFSNVGFIGIPVVRGILGSEYVIYVACFGLVFNVLFYTYGMFMLEKATEKISKLQENGSASLPYAVSSNGIDVDGAFNEDGILNPGGLFDADGVTIQDNAAVSEAVKKTKGSLLRQVINIGTVSSVLGMALFLGHIQLPYVIKQTIDYLGNVSVPLPLMITGMTLAQQDDLKKILSDGKMYLFSAIKMVAIPAVFAIALIAIHVPKQIQILSVLMFGMPVGNLPLMVLTEKEWPTELCTEGIILTTVLSVVTIPVTIWIYNMLLAVI